MKKMNVMVELKYSTKLEAAAFSMEPSANKDFASGSVFKSKHFSLDVDFGATCLTTIRPSFSNEKGAAFFSSEGSFELDADPTHSTYLVRGEVNEKELAAFEKEMASNNDVVGVYADIQIEPQVICPGSPANGTDEDVERLLCVSGLKKRGMTGKGVAVAIVDTGVNMRYLNEKGKSPVFNREWSWKPASSTITVGEAPVGHGTMCAYDVCIAAPKCTLLDIALLTTRASGDTVMSGFLSDAIKAYEHLIKFMNRSKRPGENTSLVVNNSWGMFHPSWDFPVGHPGNFSHNPSHPFNLIVRRLSLLGADILFAAGNCGPECPDGRCQNVTDGGIYGANSSPFVTSVAGVATDLTRVGYSNVGPGCLTDKKPDITGYTHFDGSGVYSADGGTSAACPVVAGVFAAIRTKRPFNPSSDITSPTAIRNLVTSTARDLGGSGYDYVYGHGLVNPCAIIKKIFPVHIPFCDRFPRICEIIRLRDERFNNICKLYPVACREFERLRIDRLRDQILPKGDFGTATPDTLDYEEMFEFLEAALSESSVSQNQVVEHAAQPAAQKTDCGCGK